ncbi:DUF4270 domain-containing protein [Flavobacterium sp. CYK-4]|uniref:DUF4270 domain-containing protein n=1 Tax=Flavobacterium lotistagni TaxID=2709660 RepID=UPI00140E7FED|nr:DUF4270 domain-containing protein [Flavobacterium lotistagni]NHM06584.1 DUF4270 domain-containing protein [Flavobacterium lotistagni]
MRKNFIFKSVLLVFLIVGIFSCDNDSNELGADIIGEDNFETGTPELYAINAENKNTGAVESLDLPINALGIYNNPVFGSLKASVAVQALIANNNLNSTFNQALNPIIESVTLKIPYFSTKGDTDDDGNTAYTLDSIYGPSNARFKLRVYESKYYIRDIDPATQTAQKYYNNQEPLFDAVKGDLLYENNQFFFDSAEIVEPGVVTDEDPDPDPIRSAPAMKLTLNPDFFTAKIINAPADKLFSNNAFIEYFRGLYFQVEQADTEANMAMMNFGNGTITIKYNQFEVDENGDPTADRETKTFVLNLKGKSVGLFNAPTPAVTNPDNIYLKGGEGSMAVIDLFGPDTDSNGVADQLETLRNNNWLVNDASLTFYIDNSAMGSAAFEPNRIYLYDLNNKRPLVDYYSDQSTPSSKPKYAKSVFGGIIKKSGTRGSYYKIRLTNHVRNLIKNDSTNVRLGLVVTENIGEVTNRKLLTPIADNIKELPLASIINPLGTILHGSGQNVPLEKRMQLKIYFTKPKQN